MSKSDSKTALCLDIDGTLYRGGSVFIESLSYLPFVQSGHWSPTDRHVLRQAIGLVGRYYGNAWTEKRWQITLRIVDLLQRIGTDEIALSSLDTLREFQTQLNSVIDPEYTFNSPSASDYDEMRISLLTTYAKAITTHHQSELRTAINDIISRCTLIDKTTATALEDISTSSSSLDIILITDMPTTIAETFASEAIEAPIQTTVATRFETDQTERFTGEFHSINKSEMLTTLDEQHDWDRIVAAGDTVRDLRMRSIADRFIAVSGQGQINEYLQKPYVTATGSNPEIINNSRDVYVPSEVPLGVVLRALLLK